MFGNGGCVNRRYSSFVLCFKASWKRYHRENENCFVITEQLVVWPARSSGLTGE